MVITHHASGSSGNAIQVDNVLIDAGVKVNAHYDLVLLTHAHTDHIKNLPYALVNAKSFYTTPEILKSLESKVVKWTKNKYNILWEQINSKLLKELPPHIQAFPLNHDIECVGYMIGDYVHITDTGTFDIPKQIIGKKFYTIESNYDEVELDLSQRPIELIERIKQTHMSNEQAIDLAIQLKAKEVMFVHLSTETNSPSLAHITHDLIAPHIKKHYPSKYQEIIL